MRTDFVLSLDGEVFWVSDRKDESPMFELDLHGGSRTVVRVVVDEPLLLEEVAEIVESFSTVLDLRSGELDISTRYDDDEDDYDTDKRVLKAPKGIYRMTVHTTFAGPGVPGSVEKETLEKYFTRTHPGETAPSWVKPDDEDCEEFWVGLILHLEAAPDAKPAKGRAKVLKSGKAMAKPAVCPPGLLSDNPLGWERFVLTDLHYIHKIPKLVAKLPPEPVSGGPVKLAVADLVLPYWIAWVCGETHPWVSVKCPPSFLPEWPGFKKGIKETKTPDGWQVDIEGMNARWSQFRHLKQVAELLSGLPDGSYIELSCASDDGEGKKGRQRYLGPVKGGEWLISETYPSMKAEVLADMLELVRQGESGTVVRARDEREADAIEKAIKTNDFLLRETPPARKGVVFQLSKKDEHLMPFLIARAFAGRYPKALSMIERDDDLGDWDAMMDKIAEAGASFATGELIHEGKFAKFTAANLAELEYKNDKLIRDYDEWLLRNGFDLLGDLNSTQTFQAVFRGYGMPAAPIYAAMLANGFGSTAFDFYTRFPDGFSLTTALSEEQKPKFSADRKLKSYRHEVPGGIEEQWKAHLDKMGALAVQHGEPEDSGDLAAFAAELDDFLCRAHGVK